WRAINRWRSWSAPIRHAVHVRRRAEVTATPQGQWPRRIPANHSSGGPSGDEAAGRVRANKVGRSGKGVPQPSHIPFQRVLFDFTPKLVQQVVDNAYQLRLDWLNNLTAD